MSEKIKFQYTFEGIPPSKKNSKQLYKNRKTGKNFVVSSDKFQSWHSEYEWKILSKRMVKLTEKGYKVGCLFYARTQGKFDLSNKWESIADLLVDCNIVVSDNYEILSEINLKFMGVDKDHPRVEVTIEL